jgi:hypothetical protein
VTTSLVKKSNLEAKPGVIVRVYEVLGAFKDTQRLNIRWDDETVGTNVRLTDLEILG